MSKFKVLLAKHDNNRELQGYDNTKVGSFLLIFAYLVFFIN